MVTRRYGEDLEDFHRRLLDEYRVHGPPKPAVVVEQPAVVVEPVVEAVPEIVDDDPEIELDEWGRVVRRSDSNRER